VTDELLKPELDYLRRIVRRFSAYAALRDDLFDAGLFRLAKALTCLDGRPAWRPYVRCAMHAGVIDEWRKYQRRKAREVLLDADENGEVIVDDVTTLDPERLCILAEDVRESARPTPAPADWLNRQAA